MISVQKRLALAVCGVATLTAFADPAAARPRHQAGAQPAALAQPLAPDERQAAVNSGAPPSIGPRAGRAARVAATRSGVEARASASEVPASVVGGSSSIVSEARRYLGSNPTNRRSLWCGAFMDLVLKRSGHAGGGNLARAYARYGTRVSGPQVGAIAVMTRGGGGHVGVVSGVDANGNPIVISGNHNNTVAESVYPKGRVIAYVIPN